MEAGSLLLRARWVVPVSRPPISEGAVFISGNHIREVGAWTDLSIRHADARRIDLGDQLLMPGLINAHCHLDYTAMAGGIPPRRSFCDWIKAILAYKADWSYTDYAASWMAGSAMLLKNGVTTVLDIEAVPELLPEVWKDSPLRLISALEMTGIRSGKNPDVILSETTAEIPARTELKSAALSPHSLYSTHPELIRLSAARAIERDWLLTSHVAESAEEMDMFQNQSGPMYDWLKGQRNMSDCRGLSPVRMLEELGALSSRFIAVHVNLLSEGDAERLGRAGASVVHCPRSHDYFRHPAFPLEALDAADVNICLGTDSLASTRGTRSANTELDLFKEMRLLASNRPELSAERIVRMTTVNAARALNRSGELGELTPGSAADLIAINVGTGDVYESILNHTGPVGFSMINGRVCLGEG